MKAKIRKDAGRTVLATFAIAAVSLVAGTSMAQTPSSIKELSKRTASMPKVVDCKKLDICDLKEAKIVERKIKVLLPDEQADYASYMTDFRFVLKFDKPANIKRYGLVQFMRGCMHQSELMPDGTIDRRFTYVHKHFGQYRLIRHDDWVVDSSHIDPMATSFENYGRFDLYKWNKDPADLDADSAEWYFDAKPTHGTVFKSELISNTGLMEGTENPQARNSSIELQTCLFKIGDVPSSSDPAGTGIDRNKALWCADWNHIFTYDFTSKKTVQETAIHPYCQEPSTGPL